MINIKDYLKINDEKNKFELPISFLEHFKFLFMKYFLINLPFTDKIFIDSKSQTYYWEVISIYLHKNFNVKVTNGQRTFGNKFLIYQANVINLNSEIVTKGHGNSFDKDIAISKSIGEFLERNALEAPTEVDLKKMKVLNLSEIAKTTKIIYDFHKIEHQYKNIEKEGVTVKTIPVFDLVNKKVVPYPAQNIFLNFSFWQQRENLMAQITTSGSGGGFTLEMATLSALYESIERDSFFCYWLTKSVPKKIVIPEGEINEYDTLKKILTNFNHDLYVLNITTDLGIPSICCVAVNKKTGGICVSGGADLNFSKAIKKSVLELYSCLAVLESEEKYEIDEKTYVPFQDTDLRRNERLRFWGHGKYVKHFEFFISGENMKLPNTEKAVPFPEVKKNNEKYEIDLILEKLKKMGNNYNDIYRFEFKNTHLKKLGFHVVRVMIPKLYPLYLNEGFSFTKSMRLEDFNLFNNGQKVFEINIYPHPFP